jgi:hypothetical protein
MIGGTNSFLPTQTSIVSMIITEARTGRASLLKGFDLV